MDDFTALLGQYFNYRVEEKKAEATGLAQAQHANTVQTTANVNQVPNQTQAPTTQGFTLTSNHLLLGSAALLVAVLVMK